MATVQQVFINGEPLRLRVNERSRPPVGGDDDDLTNLFADNECPRLRETDRLPKGFEPMEPELLKKLFHPKDTDSDYEAVNRNTPDFSMQHLDCDNHGHGPESGMHT